MMKSNDNGFDTNQNLTNFLANPSISLRSLLKNGGLFSIDSDVESSDNLAEILGNGTEFNLHRLLSDCNGSDMNIDLDETMKIDFNKPLEFRSMSELDVNILFDQINPSGDSQCNQMQDFAPMTNDCLSEPFNELCSSGVDSLNDEVFQSNETQLKVEYNSATVYTEMNSFEPINCTPNTNQTNIEHFTFDSATITNYEHDYSSISNPLGSIIDTPTPSPVTSVPKRAARRTPIRTSSRLQSRAKLISFDEILNENCVSPSMSETSSTSMRRTKRIHSVQRATDIQNDEDRSYYLERRRRNNEASKISRAARKQKFDEMDSQCVIFERKNGELKEQIDALQTVVAALRRGLVNNLQRQSPID